VGSSASLNTQAQNLSWLALDNHLAGTAANLAVNREPLQWNARIHRQIEALAAIRALDGFGEFHLGRQREGSFGSTRIQPAFSALSGTCSFMLGQLPRGC